MVNPKKTRPQEVKQIQIRNLIIVIAVISILFGGMYYFLEHDSGKAKQTKTSEVRFSSPMNNDAINQAWLEQFQTQVSDQEKQTHLLKDQIAKLEKQKTSLGNQTNKDMTEKYQAVIAKLSAVEKELAQLKSQKSDSNSARFRTVGQNSVGTQFPTIPAETNIALNSADMSVPAIASDGDDYLHLVARHKGSRYYPRQNPNNYVPSGTHVLGVLLMGADMVTDSYDQSNPKPVLIRLINNGTLPNHQLSHLKGCVITAAMRGDISSSRGDVRLERMSCVRPDHSIIDVSVNGTVATHAKEGISGQLYTREGSRVGAATIAGTMAGVANGVSQGYVNYQNSIFGPTGTIDKGQLAKYGALQGASTGLNKLSDFEMDRADQIHPIIEVNGGKLVTVVFTQGFYIDGRDSNHANTAIEDPNPWKQKTDKAKLANSAQMVTELLAGTDH